MSNPYMDDDGNVDMEEAKKAFHEKYPEIEPENRAKYSWMMMVPYLLVFLVQLGLMFFVLQLMFVYKVVNFTEGSYMGFVADLVELTGGTTFNLVVSVLYALITSVWFGIWYRRKFYPSACKHESSWKKNPVMMIVGILCVGIGAQYLCTYLMNGLAMMFPSWLVMYQQLMENVGLGTGELGVLTVIYTVLIGPVAEELTFRGLTLGYGRKSVPFWMANVTQALLFAMLHMNPLQSIYTFVLGLLLGYMVYQTDSIVTGILAHMCFNFIGAVIPGVILGGTTPVTFFIFLLAAMIVTYLGIELIRKCNPR